MENVSQTAPVHDCGLAKTVQPIRKARRTAYDRRQIKTEKAKEAKRALRAYEFFHELPANSATLQQVQATSAGIDGYARYAKWADIEQNHQESKLGIIDESSP